MIENLNDYLRMLEVPFGMTYEEVKALYAEDLVRERHIAKALRIKVFQVYKDAGDRSAMLTLMFAGKPPQSGLDDYSGLENEFAVICSRLEGLHLSGRRTRFSQYR
jgi:hypothetical protein